MIEVLGRATSGNVQFVMWTLAEVGLEASHTDLGGAFGGLDTPEFRALNPNGLIPVVRIDDTVLFESAAIVRYLAAARGSESFWPRDPLRRAELDKWAEWVKTTFQPAFFGGVFGPLVFQKPEQRNADAIAAAAKKLEGLATMADARLARGGDYLGGDELSFADIMLGTPLYRYFTLDFPRAATPKLEAYYHRLTGRPAYARHVMISFEAMRVR